MPAGGRIADFDELRRRRAAAQLLHRPTAVTEPVEVARAVAGVQAQDQFAARLQFRSRTRRLTAAEVDRARTEERSLLRTWVMRMTIHTIASEDAPWMLPLFEPVIERWSRRRLGQLGMPPADQDRALGIVARELGADGPLTRTELADRVTSRGVELNAQTRGHIMGLAVTSGTACLGPDRGATTCLVRREEWLGKPAPYERQRALAELARRYLGGFAPATDRDLAYWSGLGLRDVRAGLQTIGRDLVEQRLGELTLLSLRGRRTRLPPRDQVRLLGAFDTYMLGYRDRGFAVSAKLASKVKEGGGGWIRPVIVHDGQVIGGWRVARRQGRLEVSLSTPGADRGLSERIDAELADISRFEGLELKLAATP